MSDAQADRVDRYDALIAGCRVQVQNQFDGRWSRGFEVVDVRQQTPADEPAYRLRRRSDRSVLPAFFDTTHIRPE